MTDPLVKAALLDLVDVMRTLTNLVDSIDQRVRALEDNTPSLQRRLRNGYRSNALRDVKPATFL